jgi:hypothetical protein
MDSVMPTAQHMTVARHWPLPVTALLLLATLAWTTSIASARSPGVRSIVVTAFGPVHTPSELYADLARGPESWVGQVALVRGRVVYSLARTGLHNVSGTVSMPSLVDPDAHGVVLPLPLAAGSTDPLLEFLRHLPLVGRFVPRPQRMRWGTVTAYRVQLRTRPDTVCGASTCYEAVLLDAAPPDDEPVLARPGLPPQPF